MPITQETDTSDSPIQFRYAQTLRYRSAATKNVVRDSVRVSVKINALVNAQEIERTGQRTPAALQPGFRPPGYALTLRITLDTIMVSNRIIRGFA